MARNHPAHLATELGNSSGPLYVEELFKNEVIPENKFSLYFTQPGSESWADLGEPFLDNVRSDSSLVEIQMIEEDFFWAGYCQGVAIGTTAKKNTYRWGTLEDSNTEKKGALYSIFDTGASSLMIGQMYYDSFIRKIMEQVPDVNWSY